MLTVLLVVATANAVNFVDGLDGLAAGVVGIGAAAFFSYAYLLAVEGGFSRLTTSALITAVLCGMCAGFLPHNVHPARDFMGDSGSMLIGLHARGRIDQPDRLLPDDSRTTVPRSCWRCCRCCFRWPSSRCRSPTCCWPCSDEPGPAGRCSRRTSNTYTTACWRSATHTDERSS